MSENKIKIIIIGSSSPKELPLQALTEPDVNLSVHPALIIQPMTANTTSGQIPAFASFEFDAANNLLS